MAPVRALGLVDPIDLLHALVGNDNSTPMPPIQGLEIKQGFWCTGCSYVCGTSGTMSAHTYENKRANKLDHQRVSGLVQQLTSKGNNGKYFRVSVHKEEASLAQEQSSGFQSCSFLL